MVRNIKRLSEHKILGYGSDNANDSSTRRTVTDTEAELWQHVQLTKKPGGLNN